MLKANAGTHNEGCRDTKANVEEVNKTRIEDKSETKTNGEKKQSSEYDRVRGAHMSKIRVGLVGIRGRRRSSNHSGDDGGTQDGNTKRSPMDVGVGTKHRIQNLKFKHDTEGGGPRRNCHGSSRNYGRQTIKAGELSEQCNNLEGRRDSGNNTSKRSK